MLSKLYTFREEEHEEVESRVLPVITTDENDDLRITKINYGWIVTREMMMARAMIRSGDPLRLFWRDAA